MKNIHILPTDKPSRLGYLTKKGKEVFKDLRLFDQLMPIILDSENQNIYITSDEKIKEGDCILDLIDLTIGKVKDAKDKHNIEILYGNQGVGLSCNVKDCSEAIKYPIIKIILTTDQDLIEDGVQAIDDEFLEWFVKNTSCEEVEVDERPITNDPKGYKSFYEIIFPKEETKQKCIVTKSMQIDAEIAYKSLPKQNIIDMMKGDEELGLYDKILPEQIWNKEKKKGIKQLIQEPKQERSYSEEDMKEAFNGFKSGKSFKDWFKQFKKK